MRQVISLQRFSVFISCSDDLRAPLPILSWPRQSRQLILWGSSLLLWGCYFLAGEAVAAQACGDGPLSKTSPSLAEVPQQLSREQRFGPGAEAQQFASPVKLENLSAQQQAALVKMVADRRKILPYRFQELYRCPSLNNQAQAAFENQDYGQAISFLDAAIAQSPNRPERWLNRAMIHYYLGEDEAALADALQSQQRLTSQSRKKLRAACERIILKLGGELPDPRRAVEL